LLEGGGGGGGERGKEGKEYPIVGSLVPLPQRSLKIIERRKPLTMPISQKRKSRKKKKEEKKKKANPN